MEESYLWECIVNLTLASYMHSQPKADIQIKRMAKRYMKQGACDKLARRTLRNVVKTGQPARLVQIAYDDLIGSVNAGTS